MGWLLMLWIIWVALRAIHQGIRRASEPYLRGLLCATFAAAVGFLVCMSGINAFYHISLQVFFWGLVGFGLCLGTHVAGNRNGFFVIWRFGDERPRPAARRSPRRGTSEGQLGLDPSGQAGLAD